MKTLSEFTRAGITNIRDLKDALQLAMQLEFSTIPPYLCAQWSIKSDPDRVEGVLHHIVSQEMNHFALAGNLLTAIGGAPRIARRRFLPKYPLHALPGGVEQKLAVALQPLTFEQLEVFMQIEYPDFPPVALRAMRGPATIGEFYDAIIEAFQTIRPRINANAHWVPVILSSRILTIADAVAAITRIKLEGEGLQDSPEQPSNDRPAHAHYYLFKEIYRQRRLVKIGDEWSFSGPQIVFPEVYDFRRSGDKPALRREFRKALTRLLTDLEMCWRRGLQPNVAGMFNLRNLGRELIRSTVRPEFVWARPWDFLSRAVLPDDIVNNGRVLQ
jgi:hypothetical protein